MFRESSRTQFARQRRRTSAIADDLYFFRLLINVLQIAVIHPLFAQLGEQQNGQSSIEIAECGSADSVLQHHALRETGRGVIASQSRERLNCVEIKFFFCYNFF